MKIIFLIPPSEGKNLWWKRWKEKLSFLFEKPIDIAQNATQKDLKCSGKRYEQGIELNTNIMWWEKLPAIERYSGVMYNAINYEGMSALWKTYFQEHFLILSGMYGIVTPQDLIGNYKLPIETNWLYKFWGDIVTSTLNELQADVIVDFLPGAYKKMIQWDKIKSTIVQIDFFQKKDGELKKLTHGVKKVKGEYIHDICEKMIHDIHDLKGKSIQISQNRYHFHIIS